MNDPFYFKNFKFCPFCGNKYDSNQASRFEFAEDVFRCCVQDRAFPMTGIERQEREEAMAA